MKGDNCRFRHDINKRAKSTLSPRSSTRQRVKNASRTRSPRGKSPSGRMSRLPSKDYPEGTCTTHDRALNEIASCRSGCFALEHRLELSESPLKRRATFFRTPKRALRLPRQVLTHVAHEVDSTLSSPLPDFNHARHCKNMH